ncbi:hypothetical protein ACWN83_06900 [Pseudolactococcus plantarum]|uniref:Uncharacterized protein n=1 Tax=Pseudolactococcus plantarum TaxID=1365 RepID=A0A2A5S3I5_9LACT|nr:hypothetical protein [Lactococcus plantarum]PCS08012.1 hypothetical protein RU87_GL000749 [Lactococcus plantarum]HCN74533.1 hypothetical protein [Lactococcus sp.]
MTILVAYLTQNNHALLPVVGAGLCSLLLGIVFVIFLPMLIENYYQNHWGMCIAYTSVGSVYILVETIVAATIITTFFIDFKGLIAISIFIFGSLIFLIGNIYLHFYVIRRVVRMVKLQKNKVSQTAVDFLEEKPFGGILILFTSYTILLLILACWLGAGFGDYKIHNILLLRIFGITILFVLPTLSVIFGLKYPRKIFVSKLQKIIDSHNEAIKDKQKTKKKNG